MAEALIECEVCGKSHRTEDALEKCKARAERALLRVAKKSFESDRRRANLEAESVRDYVFRRLKEGGAWVNVVAGLKRDYPPPTLYNLPNVGEKWDVAHVGWILAEEWNLPGLDTETKWEMKMERHFIGTYLTVHPLEYLMKTGAFDGMDVLWPSQVIKEPELEEEVVAE
jgi:hypothetical protein